MKTRTLIGGTIAMGSIVTFGCASEAPDTANSEVTEQSIAATPSRTLDPSTRFFVPAPDVGATNQVVSLFRSKDIRSAADIIAMEATGHAVWFTGGAPADVQKAVQETMKKAAHEHRVPVLVAYNVPYRDCAQYSAGGATDTAAYEAWIDGFAKGIGKGKAVVILEPDSLGIIPNNVTIFGSAEWCKPTVTDASGAQVTAPGANPTERYAQLNYAVDGIERNAPQAAVYLDGTHGAWLGFGEAAYRLMKAGVLRAQGFFTNVSNYQLTSDSVQFGTWISDALAAATGGPSWAYDAQGNFHFDWLPSQYDPATNYTSVNYSAAYVSTVNASLQGFMNGSMATTHFVIDTSRNGNGTLDTAQYASAPYNQPATTIAGLSSGNWCNPPGAGLGLRPTANTGVSLLDAYLWVKVPGESDGSCDIAGGARAWDYTQYDPWSITGDAQNHFDPLWGVVDPAAGAWFPQQALQLARQANPPLF